MPYVKRSSRVPTFLLAIAQVLAVTGDVKAQESQYITVTSDTLKTLAQRLKQDLQDGSVRMADLHAIELRLALSGRLGEELTSSVGLMEQIAQPQNDPKWTAGLVPIANQLIDTFNEPDLASAKKYAEQLTIQIHKQHEFYTGKQLASIKTGDIVYDRFFSLSRQLGECLREGDVAKAAVLAVDVQATQDVVMARSKYPVSSISRNIYDINDALGRAAFLAKDYLAASDYLLKAADTPGKDPALSTFGPDLWLARALVGVGYRDVVLTFLERCKAFWPKPQLDDWISVLQNGGSPNFSHQIFSADPILSH